MDFASLSKPWNNKTLNWDEPCCLPLFEITRTSTRKLRYRSTVRVPYSTRSAMLFFFNSYAVRYSYSTRTYSTRTSTSTIFSFHQFVSITGQQVGAETAAPRQPAVIPHASLRGGAARPFTFPIHRLSSLCLVC